MSSLHGRKEEQAAMKQRARMTVRIAIRNGKLKRQPCEVCKLADGVQAHHDDYLKPLAVRWLCRFHHKQQHIGSRRFITPDPLNPTMVNIAIQPDMMQSICDLYVKRRRQDRRFSDTLRYVIERGLTRINKG